eukprot:s1440_g6.t1
MACIPIAVPFSVPQVSSDSWLANKRARAFHRGVVITVYSQGILTLLKLSRGDLVGGLYDGVLCAMGTYAIQPEGHRFFPTYIICCGFNGLLALLQILQGYQGVPVHFLPLLAILPPSIALFGAYCGWQFCKEVTAIAAGHAGAGPQDSCFVRVMGADWWPAFLGPQVAQREERNFGRPGESQGSVLRDRFSAKKIDEDLFEYCWNMTRSWLVLKRVPEYRFDAELQNVQEYMLGACIAMDKALERPDVLPARVQQCLWANMYSGSVKKDHRGLTRLTKYMLRQLGLILQLDSDRFLTGQFIWADFPVSDRVRKPLKLPEWREKFRSEQVEILGKLDLKSMGSRPASIEGSDPKTPSLRP